MIGKKLGPYDIIEEIGKGGMATVYRAYQPNVDRDVAVKVISHNIAADEEAMERFQQEARLIARLEHPHILPIYDFNGNHTPPYIVMRYLDSGTLKSVLAHKTLPLEEVSYIIQQVASALDYAHRRGIIHRDIKPSNIMVDRDGNAFVTDLGVARMTNLDKPKADAITAPGSIVGTPEYMSPEQAMGEEIDHRTDIYALGTMLYEMVTGRKPFEGKNPTATMLMHVHDPVPSAAELNPNLPHAIDEIVWRSMAKSPEDRYDSMADFAEAVAEIFGTATGVPVTLKDAIKQTIEMSETGDDSDITDTATPAEQHKQVTTMFANFTELEEVLLDSINAEVVHWIMESLFMQFHDITNRYGGQIYEATDRTILAIWGVEHTHENDPELAISAALEMAQCVEPAARQYVDKDEAMPFQIAINSGPALIQPSSDERSYSVTGTTINLARRIERDAPPGTIIITYDTYRFVMGMFEVSPLNPIRVRGRKEQVNVYEVKSLRPRRLRVPVRAIEGVETKTIGRESELKRMQDALLISIEDQETQIITVSGEMGIGKSRVLYEFRRWLELDNESVWILQGRSVKQHINTPFYTLRDIISTMFTIYDSDPANTVRKKVEQGYHEITGDLDPINGQVFGRLLGYNFNVDQDAHNIIENTAQHASLRSKYLYYFFNMMTEQTPVVIQLEDFQWADDASLDFINQMVMENQQLPLTIICVARPELYERRPAWGEGHEYHTHIRLEPLSKRDARRLIREILQRVDDVPTDLRDMLVQRSEGNPYYIEEIIKVLIEDEIIFKQSVEKWVIHSDQLAQDKVPATLAGVLQARLDALTHEEYLVMQRASVIGRIFWDQSILALEAADGVFIDDIQALLGALHEREMIHVREDSMFNSAHEYIFHHTMLRDVVYASIPEHRRREYHAAVSEWFSKVGGDRLDEFKAIIEQHTQLAGQ